MIKSTGLAALALVLAATAAAQDAAPDVVVLTPANMKRASQGAYARPGMQQANLIGDPAKTGPSTIRLRFPKGMRIEVHSQS
jgi:hypothetical protein